MDNKDKNNVSDPYFAYRQTVPVGWKKLSIGEVTKIIRGISFPKDSKRSEPQSGYVACLRTANVQTTVEWDDLWFVPEEMVKRKEQIVEVGDILISTANSNYLVGKVSPVISIPQKSTLGAFISLLRPNKEVDRKFIYHQLAWSDTQARIRSTASTTTNISNVSTKKLSNIELVIPPFEQQKRIVGEIEKQFSRLDEAVANLKRVKANLKRYKAAVLKAAVEGKLTEEWRKQHPDVEPATKLLKRILAERRQKWEEGELAKMKAKGKVPSDDKWKMKYAEPADLAVNDLPELPEGWVWSSVAKIGRVIGGLTKNQKRVALPMKLPYLRVANVYANELRLEEIKTVGVGDGELEKLLVKKDDLLIVEGNGSPDQIGRLAIWDGSISPCVHQNHLIKVRLSKSCLPQWAVCWLLSLDGRNCIRNVASSTSGLYTLSVGKVSGLPVPLPPLVEQQRIVDEVDLRISLVHEVETQLERNLKRAERLRQSILSQAFSGQLIN